MVGLNFSILNIPISSQTLLLVWKGNLKLIHYFLYLSAQNVERLLQVHAKDGRPFIHRRHWLLFVQDGSEDDSRRTWSLIIIFDCLLQHKKLFPKNILSVCISQFNLVFWSPLIFILPFVSTRPHLVLTLPHCSFESEKTLTTI